MKLEKVEKSMIFSETIIPDIFFAEYLSNIPGNYVKIYLYISFLSKYGKEIRINDLAKKLSLDLKEINEGMEFLARNELIIKKGTGYTIIDLQEVALNNLYVPKIQTAQEKIEENSKNKSRLKVIEHINNRYFQGIMGPSWYNDIDLWFRKFNFDEQVMIALFDYCFNRSALHRNYVQAVAEAWGANKIETWNDLDSYYQKEEKLTKIKKSIAKKLGKHSGLTQYEEAYIETWVNEYGYDLNIIEIALKRTTFRANPTFEYINNIIKDWNERNLKTTTEIEEFLEQRKKQAKDIKELNQKVKKESFEQREYTNLDFLYANKNIEGEQNV